MVRCGRSHRSEKSPRSPPARLDLPGSAVKAMSRRRPPPSCCREVRSSRPSPRMTPSRFRCLKFSMPSVGHRPCIASSRRTRHAPLATVHAKAGRAPPIPGSKAGNVEESDPDDPFADHAYCGRHHAAWRDRRRRAQACPRRHASAPSCVCSIERRTISRVLGNARRERRRPAQRVVDLRRRRAGFFGLPSPILKASSRRCCA